MVIDFCWLFCPLKLDLESRVPIPSASPLLFHENPELLSPLSRMLFSRSRIPCSNWGETLFSRATRKIGFTQICLVQIWCKKVQTRRKSEAKMANQALAYQFTRGCKFVGKCSIYHLWPWFNLTAHFFAPYLHWINLVKIKFFVQWWGSLSNSVSR